MPVSRDFRRALPPARALAGAAALAALLALPGCSKSFWRHNADAEAYGLALEKAQDPRWAPPRLDVIPDPRSRFFDPAHPDCEPVPPDDPAANVYMNRMGDFGRIAGDDDWHEEYGYTPFVENPLWLARFGQTRAGVNAAWERHRAKTGGGVRLAAYQEPGESGETPAPQGAEPSATDRDRGVRSEFGDVPDDPFAVPVEPPLRDEPLEGDAPELRTGPVTRNPAAAVDQDQAPLREPADADDLGRGSGAADLQLTPDEGEFEGLSEGEDVGGSNLDAGNPFLPPIYDLTLNGAVELAYIHNRDYQTVLEDVYLRALQLAFERFRFDIRFLGVTGQPPGVDVNTLTRPSGGANDVNVDANFGVSRLLPAGGQWAVELVNNTLTIFGTGAQSGTASTISFSLVQPLLRGAGRKVNLEALTQAERNLLYAVRDLARFRKQFFVDTVTDGPGGGILGLLTQVQAINNLRDNIRRTEELLTLRRTLDARRPAVFTLPIAGLPADVLAELDVPGLDEPGEDAGPAGEGDPPRTVREILEAGERVPGLKLPFPGELEGVVRYDAGLGGLQIVGDVTEGEEEALLALSDDPAFRDAAADLVTQIRVQPITSGAAQLESRLIRNITSLRNAEAQLQNSLDQYKFFLGLPPDMVVTLEESFLEPFGLIDPSLIEAEGVVDEFVSEWAALDLIGTAEEKQAAVADLPAGAVGEVVERLAALNERTRSTVQRLREDDLARVRASEDERLDALDALQRARFSRDLDRDERTLDTIGRELDRRGAALEELAAALAEPGVTAVQKVLAADLVAEFREALLRDARGLQVVQTGLRVEQIALNPFDLPLDEAVRVALESRLDLMNRRAFVTDARRQLELAANALQAVLDVVAEGNVRTLPRSGVLGIDRNPLSFRADQSDFRLGVRFDTPLDRVAERNQYRAALIDYQRARRDYIAFEDSVRADVRVAWRDLATLKENFETTRQGVRIAAIQFDTAIERQFDPEARVGGGAGQFDTLTALSSLLESSNDLIRIWVDYERARLQIYRDMGIMVVGPEGLWRDPFYTRGPLRVTTPELDGGELDGEGGPGAPGLPNPGDLEPREAADLDAPDRGEPPTPDLVPSN